MSLGLRVPLHVFRFRVDFVTEDLSSGLTFGPVAVSAAFSDCTGLDATMQPKKITEGGRNYGDAVRAGPVTFALVMLKRGITPNLDLWNIFGGTVMGLNPRMQVTITVFDLDGSPAVAWQLDNAMAIRYKFADLNGRGGGEVGIEELHLVHEGLSSATPSPLVVGF
jgi:phage tail-like protein